MIIKKKYKEFPEIEIINNEFLIEGELIPEDATIAWYPFINKLEEYVEKKESLTANFKIELFNTSSSMYISRIIKLLYDLSKNAKVIINWYYDKKDETILEFGEDYKEIYEKSNVDFEFNLIEN